MSFVEFGETRIKSLDQCEHFGGEIIDHIFKPSVSFDESRLLQFLSIELFKECRGLSILQSIYVSIAYPV